MPVEVSLLWGSRKVLGHCLASSPHLLWLDRSQFAAMAQRMEQTIPVIGTHIVRVTLQDEPTIYREIEIESRKALSDLAEAIVHAFGFEFDHAFGFYSKLTGRDVMRSQPKYELFVDMGEQTSAKSVRKTTVADAFPDVGHTMLFMFDYGDDWRFIVEVIGLGQKAAKTRYPKVLKKVGQAPEQYGAWDDDEDEH
jgi:Plasmid pRiA4b ORF-3-like protein